MVYSKEKTKSMQDMLHIIYEGAMQDMAEVTWDMLADLVGNGMSEQYELEQEFNAMPTDFRHELLKIAVKQGGR